MASITTNQTIDYLRDISDFIDDLEDRGPNDDITLRVAPLLEKQMSALLHKLRAQLDNIRAKRATLARELMLAQARTRHASSSTAQRATKRIDSTWTVARRRAHPSKHSSSSSSMSSFATMGLPPSIVIPTRTTIPITDRIHLQCITVETLSDVCADGMLYYVPSINRFAIHLAGIVLYGNIGNVYVSEQYPQKIHDCNVFPRCAQTCKYYHNPVTCAHSTDVRNFISASWLYSHDASIHDTKKVRKLSSREFLDHDIEHITDKDLAFYNEQMMHDLLCAIIMNYYVPRYT
ncbi:MAG: hypothetical protein WC919_04990 [Candidatus Paceibacterota bacterium]|jgi:hypothetical protein